MSALGFTPHRPHFTASAQTAAQNHSRYFSTNPRQFLQLFPHKFARQMQARWHPQVRAGLCACPKTPDPIHKSPFAVMRDPNVGAGLCACPVSLKKPFQDAADGSAPKKSITESYLNQILMKSGSPDPQIALKFFVTVHGSIC